MNQGKWAGGLRAGWLLALLLAGLLCSHAAAQTTSERLQQLQQTLRQQKNLNDQQAAQLQALSQSLQNLSAQQKQALAQLDTLAAQVASLENELADIGAQVALAERTLAATVAQQQLTQAQVDSLKADVRSVLNALYRERNGQYLALVSQSKTLSDLLIRLDYANIAGDHNLKAISELREATRVLQQQQALQTRQTQALRALQAQQSAKLGQLQSRHAEQQALLAQLQKTAEGQRAIAVQKQAEQALTAQSIDQLVGQVVQERQRIEAERRRKLEEERQRRLAEARRIAAEQEKARLEAIRLAKLRAEQERRAREAQQARERAAAAAAAEAQRQRQVALQRQQAALQQRSEQVNRDEQAAQVQLAPLPPRVASSAVASPLPGGQLTAPYGQGGSQWVLFSGPNGAQATAALPGNVLAATYYASLGWVVLLDNGGGTVTGYFGLRNAGVSVGQRVNAGAPLGAVGGSPIFGASSMAFQLRQGGQPVAPRFK